MAENLRICLIGSTGNGKSTLGNVLLGLNINGLEDKNLVGFRVEPDADICTTVTKKMANHWLGDASKNEVVEIIDTPGHGGGGDKAEDYRQAMVNFIRSQKSIDAIICVRNSQQPRFDSHDVEAFRVFTEMFGLEKFFQNLVIVLSRWSSAPGEISQQEKSGATLEKLIGNLRAQMESRYPGVSRNIPILALDALYWPDDDRETRTFMEGAGTLLSILKEYHKNPLIVGAVKMVEDQDKKLERNVAALQDTGNALQRQHEKDIHDQRQQLEDKERKYRQLAALDAEQRASKKQKGFLDKAGDFFRGSGTSSPSSSNASSGFSVGNHDNGKSSPLSPAYIRHAQQQQRPSEPSKSRSTHTFDQMDTSDQYGSSSNEISAGGSMTSSKGTEIHSASLDQRQLMIQQRIGYLEQENHRNREEIARLKTELSQLQQSRLISPPAARSQHSPY